MCFCIVVDSYNAFDMEMEVNLYTDAFFPGLYVKPEKSSIFLKKGKTVISVENRKFSRSRITKRTAPLNSSREI